MNTDSSVVGVAHDVIKTRLRTLLVIQKSATNTVQRSTSNPALDHLRGVCHHHGTLLLLLLLLLLQNEIEIEIMFMKNFSIIEVLREGKYASNSRVADKVRIQYHLLLFVLIKKVVGIITRLLEGGPWARRMFGMYFQRGKSYDVR
jgi:hypothetical protein